MGAETCRNDERGFWVRTKKQEETLTAVFARHLPLFTGADIEWNWTETAGSQVHWERYKPVAEQVSTQVQGMPTSYYKRTLPVHY